MHFLQLFVFFFLQQCMFQQNATGENFTKEGRTRMFSNIFKVCSQWTEHFACDFTDKTMRHRLIELLNLLPVDAKSKRDVETLMENLNNKVFNKFFHFKLNGFLWDTESELFFSI